MVLNGDLKLFQLTLNFRLFKQTVQTLIRRRVQRCLIWVCTVCQCPSPGFTDTHLYTIRPCHSDKNSGLTSLVNNNHVDNNLKEILVYVSEKSSTILLQNGDCRRHTFTLSGMGKKIRRRHFSYFSQKIGFDVACKLSPEEKNA